MILKVERRRWATSYSVFRGTSPGGEGATAVGSTVGRAYFDTGLTNGVTYYYKVTASDSLGTSIKSPEATAPESAVPARRRALRRRWQCPGCPFLERCAGASGFDIFSSVSPSTGYTLLELADDDRHRFGVTNGVYLLLPYRRQRGGESSRRRRSRRRRACRQHHCGGAASRRSRPTPLSPAAQRRSTTHSDRLTQIGSPVPPQAVLQTNAHGAMTYTIGGLAAGSSHAVTLTSRSILDGGRQAHLQRSTTGRGCSRNFDIFAAPGAV